MVSSQFHYTKRNRFMPFLLAEILNFQGSTHHIGVGSFSILFCGGLILLSLLLTKSNWRGIIVISALLESLSILPCKRNKI